MALRVELRYAVGRLELGNHSRQRYSAGPGPPGRTRTGGEPTQPAGGAEAVQRDGPSSFISRLVTAHVEAHRGRIVKNQGDGYMLCFRSARHALLACIGLQRDLERKPPLPDGWTSGRSGGDRLRVRMGAHTGEVMMQDDGDLFDKHVIVAARIGAQASGGQILVSNLVKQIAEPRGDISFGPPMEVRLKGIDGPTLVHEIDWAAAGPEPSG